MPKLELGDLDSVERNMQLNIPLLVESFFRKMRLKNSKAIDGIREDTMDILMRHSWPGNVRELKGALEYSFVTCHTNMIHPSHLTELRSPYISSVYFSAQSFPGQSLYRNLGLNT